MPEGPEVETVRRTLAPLVTGARLGVATVSALPLRTPITGADLAFLAGRVVSDVGRRGKTLWLRVGDDANDGTADGDHDGIVVRLGMTGQLTVTTTSLPVLPHTHVRVPLVDARGAPTGTELRFRDPRRFGEVVPFRGSAGLAALDLTTGRPRTGPRTRRCTAPSTHWP